jgi:hypothetical protein
MMVKKRKSKRNLHATPPQKREAAPTQEPIISAQVVLKAPPEYRDVPATAATIASIMPPAQVISAITEEFRRRGFEIGPVVGTSFSISASPRTFEATFHTRLPRDENGRLDLNPAGQGYELPLAQIPHDISKNIQAVVFTPPPDFGPTGSY